MAKIGYARVSTTEQHLDRQEHALAQHGAEKVFFEKISGAKKGRPQLDAMLGYVRDNDTLIVESFSRLARSTRDLLRIVDTLQEKNVELVSLKESIDTTKPAGRLFLTIMAALSEFERDTILERQKEGIEAARKRGQHMGRPPVEIPSEWDEVMREWKKGTITATGAMRRVGMSRATFYRRVKRWESE